MNFYSSVDCCTAAPVTSVASSAPAASSAAHSAAVSSAPEVGTGFTKSPSVAPDLKQPLPCGGTSSDQLYPNALRTELIAAKGNTVQFQEAVKLFLDPATAESAFTTSAGGLDCAKGSIGGTAVTIGKAQDVTATVGGTKSTAWEISLDGATGTLILTHAGSVVVGYSFLAATGTDPTTLPDAISVAKKATAKLIAAQLG